MSEELKPCPFCGTAPTAKSISAGMSQVECEPCGIWIDGFNTEVHAAWNRRTAPVSAPLDTQALPPIERDEQMDRTYIPLPGGWEIQTKGTGSTFRIAHVPASSRWMVLADELHEPLEAMARDSRKLIEQYAERIRHLERELAELREASLAMSAELSKFQGAAYLAKIDGRTAGTAPEGWKPVHQTYYGVEGWRDIEEHAVDEHKSMGFEVRTVYIAAAPLSKQEET